MTHVVVHRIRCDAVLDNRSGCWTEWDSPADPRTATELRAHLRTVGWHRTRTGDICPDCWNEGRR